MMVKSILSFLFITVPAIIHATPIQSRAITGKRGVAFEIGGVTKLFDLSWGYNWLSTGSKTAVPGKFEYVPMLHSDSYMFTSVWEKDVAASVKAGTKHILSFNEPDQCGGGGSCMQDVGRTVKAHKDYVQPLAKKYSQLRVGAPAVTNGVLSTNNTVMGTDFLRPFIKACDSQSIKVDFVVAHWYDQWPSSSAERATKLKYFKDHMRAIYEAGGKRKVWVTEFGVWSGDKVNFLETVMPWLDGQSWIERYAFHYATQGVLVTGDLSGLTSLGQTYASAR